MNDLGDRKEDSLLYFLWNSNSKSGASITRATNGQVRVYKNDDLAQSTAGIVDTEDFDGLTGVHCCKIDLSADAFYEVKKDYTVVLQGAVIDDETVNAVLATFSIENRAADVVRINGHRTNANLATLKLAQLDIWGTEDNAVKLRVSSELGDIPALYAKGVGGGAGMKLEGGDTGPGLLSKGGVTGGDGTICQATGINAKGLKCVGSENGAALDCGGGLNGIKSVGVANGIYSEGTVTNGIQIQGATYGMAISSPGKGIKISAADEAIDILSNTKDAIKAVAGGNGSGLYLVKAGTGQDIKAVEIGTKFTLDGSVDAGILEVLKKIVDDNAGATYDATTDSLAKIRLAVGGGGITSQQVRDSMKLAPTGGAPAAGSVDEHLDTMLSGEVAIYADTQAITGKLPTNNIMGSSVKTDKDDEIDSTLSIVQNIQNNTRCVVGLPAHFYIPESSYTVYKIVVNLYDTQGAMEDPDNQEFAILMETANAISKVGLLYKEYACTNLLDVAPNFTNYKKLMRVGDNGDGTGQYYCFVKIASTEITTELMYDFACYENGGYPLHFVRSNNITIAQVGDVTLEDSVENKQIIASSLRSEDVSAIPVVTGSILKDLQIRFSALPTEFLNTPLDGVTLSTIYQLVMAMANGRIKKDFPNTGDLTFYKRDNSTVMTVTHTTSSERSRIS